MPSRSATSRSIPPSSRMPRSCRIRPHWAGSRYRPCRRTRGRTPRGSTAVSSASAPDRSASGPPLPSASSTAAIALERLTADPAIYPAGTNYFNTTDDENSFDKRSPRRGPQPLGIASRQGRRPNLRFRRPGEAGRHHHRRRDRCADRRAAGLRQYPRLHARSEQWRQPGHARRGQLRGGRSGTGGRAVHPGRAQPEPAGRLLVVNYDTSGSTRVFEVVPTHPSHTETAGCVRERKAGRRPSRSRANRWRPSIA